MDAVADVVELGAMVKVEGAGREPALAELKGVSAQYPLFGDVVTEPAGVAPGALGEDELIAAPELLAQLGVGLGDEVVIGSQAYTVAAALVDEPDRVDFAMTLGPRAFVSQAGLERTGLVQFGSRVSTSVRSRCARTQPPGRRAAGGGPAAEVVDAPYLTFKTFDKPSPALTRALDRIASYLGLVALLSLLLGGIGVAQVVRAWLGSRTPAIATLRSLGFRPREVFAAYFGHVLILSFIGCVIGIGVGLSAPYLVGALAPDLMASGAGPVQWGAALRGLVLGMGTAAVFSLPPLTAVWRVSRPGSCARRSARCPRPRRCASGPPSPWFSVCFCSPWCRPARSCRPWPSPPDSGPSCCCSRGRRSWFHGWPFGYRGGAWASRSGMGVAALARPGQASSARRWPGPGDARGPGPRDRGDPPGGGAGERCAPDAPTVFLVDVQPDQWDGVQEIMVSEGMQNIDSTPVVMARLSEWQGRRCGSWWRTKAAGETAGP